jgi:predicted amidohydrolase YtcJ
VLGDSGLSRGQALRLASVAGHFLTRDENHRGPLAPGMDADLVVLDGDPLDCPLDRLPSLPIDLTMVGGRVVHDLAQDGLPALP